MECPAPENVQAFLDGALPAPQQDAVFEHLGACARCAELVAALVADEAPPAEKAPERIGRFEVRAPLGAGGMGVVYSAFDPELGRPVALKLLRGAQVDGARLLREAQAMARLSHPNVVAVYETGSWNGRVFLAMELVAGQTLAKWSAGRSWREIVDAFLAAGAGLAAAHAAGLVHRDFKPENVLVGSDGRVRVTDFGLAHLEAGGEPPSVAGARGLRLTRAGTILGSPAYMAPEQMSGGAVDARSDVFSFCVALFECLTGERPFAGETLPALRAEIEAGHVRALPRSRAPARVARVLRRGLATRPEARYPAMQPLLADLQRARRGPRRAVAGALGVAAVLAAVLLSPRKQWHAEIVTLPGVHEENAEHPALSPDGALMAYSSDREDRQLWRLYVEPAEGGDAVAVTPAGGWQHCARFTRDGKHLLYVDSADGEVWRASVAGSAPEKLGAGEAICVDDCGKAGILVQRAGAPDCPACERLVLLAGGAEREVFRVRGRLIQYPRCDRDGERAVFVAKNGSTADLHVVSLTGADRVLLHDADLSDAELTADGRGIVYAAPAAGRVNLFELPIAGGAPRRVTDGPGPDRAPVPTPDGRALLFELDDTPGQLSVLDLRSGRRKRLSGWQDVRVAVSATLSLDGRAVFAQAQRADGAHVAELPLDGSTPRMLAAGADPFPTPDDREIVFTARAPAGRFEVRAVPRAGGPSRLVTQGEGTIRELLVARDGRVHLTVERGDEHVALSAPLDGGGLALDAPAPWQLVVPLAGGWTRAVRTEGYYGMDYFLPPGAALTPALDPRAIRVRAYVMAFTRDFATAIYADGRRVVAFTPQTGERRALYEIAMPGELGLSADGATLLLGEFAGGVRRQLVRNFGERPR